MNDFEKRLSGIPLNPPAPDLRSAILASAERERSRRNTPVIPAFLRSHPFAWAALAAGWLVIGYLNFAGPSGSELNSLAISGRPSPTAPQVAEYIERRRLLLRFPSSAGQALETDRSKL